MLRGDTVICRHRHFGGVRSMQPVLFLLYFISALDKTLIPTISIRAEQFSTGITTLTSQLALMLV